MKPALRKSNLLASLGLSLLAAASCGNDPAASGSGGQNGSGGTTSSGGATASGGATSSGGTTASGGASSSGGASGSGGATSSGGASGSGGATSSGGTSGSGGATASGGTNAGLGGGGHPGIGGKAGAGGGPAGTGGQSAAGHGGETGASGGAGGDAGLLSVAAAWDGQLVTYPCGSSGGGYDCANVGCTGNMVKKTSSWKMAGTATTTYSVTFNVRGVVETYSYIGGTRDGGSITTNPDLFQRGGMVQASGGLNYDYNYYKLEVSPAVTGEANVYYLNSVTAAESPSSSNTTKHLSFPINYTKTIKVMGNSTVSLEVLDTNCTQIQNCGPTMGSTCAAPRTISLAGVTPAAPATFMQPFQMPTGRYGQWVFFDVTNVTAN